MDLMASKSKLETPNSTLGTRRWSHMARSPGQIMVLFAFSITVMLLGMVLAIDGGNIFMERRSAQNAADAGTLAGIRCIAKQWQLAPSQGASDADKCAESSTGLNVWTEVAKAVNCNQQGAPLVIQAVEYVDMDGDPIAEITGTQGGCPLTGGTDPTTTDDDAWSATSYSDMSGIRVRVDGVVTTYFLRAGLLGVGRETISPEAAGATADGGFPVEATATARIGMVSDPSTVTAPITPFLLCGGSANTWDSPHTLVNLINADGTINDTYFGTKFVLLNNQTKPPQDDGVSTCGLSSAAFKGRSDDDEVGEPASTGSNVQTDGGIMASVVGDAVEYLCGSDALGTECEVTLPLIGSCSGTGSSGTCTVTGWATFRITYESATKVSATLVPGGAAPVISGTTSGWTTFGDPNSAITVIKLSS